MKYQAQKTIDMSAQKLSLLKISLDNRLEEFPHLAEPAKVNEENKDCPPLLPRPNQMTGTLYVKVLGVEGLMDLQALREADSSQLGGDSPSQGRSYSVGPSSRLGAPGKYMTLPNPHHRDKAEDHEGFTVPAGTSTVSSPGSSSTLHWPSKPRRTSRHHKSSTHTKSEGEEGGNSSCCKEGGVGVRVLPCGVGVRVLPCGVGVRVLPCGVGVRVLPCGVGVRVLPCGVGVRVLPCGVGVRVLPCGVGVRVLPCGVGVRVLPCGGCKGVTMWCEYKGSPC